MLALLGDWEHFASSVEWIGKNLQFDIVSLSLSLSLSLSCKLMFQTCLLGLVLYTFYIFGLIALVAQSIYISFG